MINFTRLSATMCLLTTLALTGCTYVHAQSKDKIKLKGDWMFILGDDMKFADPEYDDSKWTEISVPSSWEAEGFQNYDGYAWYRKTFTLDLESNEGHLILHLGRIDDVDEVYLNGEFIGRTGSFPPNYATAFNISRSYPVPASLFNKNGENVIAVRVYDSYASGGIMDGYIGIDNFTKFKHSVWLSGTWQFRISDDMDWADPLYDDSDWEPIVVPTAWDSQGFSNYDGYAWYRKTFVYPKDDDSEHKILLLGKIDDFDEVFLNGIKIGSTGDMENGTNNNSWSKYRNYIIPKGVLKKGKENTVAVRVYDSSSRGGIYEGPITIIDTKDYREFWKIYRKNEDNFYLFRW